MIYTGLTGWGDHYDLYTNGVRGTDKLGTYSSFFPTVEVDSTYYAVQSETVWEKWIRDTPDNFRFVVKAYAGMTGQLMEKPPFPDELTMFEAFRTSLNPLIESGKLAMILCQFPPWFDCTKEHVMKLRNVREMLSDVPVAIEFRHQSWYSDQFREQTLAFLHEHDYIHSVCDEPQAGEGSIPIVPVATHKEKTLVRLHGRNKAGWRKETAGADWRKVRYLYDYNQKEIQEWLTRVEELHETSTDVYVIWNNNSGGHAAGNARTFLDMAGITYEGLAPKQLSLFEEER